MAATLRILTKSSSITRCCNRAIAQTNKKQVFSSLNISTNQHIIAPAHQLRKFESNSIISQQTTIRAFTTRSGALFNTLPFRNNNNNNNEISMRIPPTPFGFRRNFSVSRHSFEKQNVTSVGPTDMEGANVNISNVGTVPTNEELIMGLFIGNKRVQLTTHSGCGDTIAPISNIVPYVIPDPLNKPFKMYLLVERGGKHMKNIAESSGFVSMTVGHTEKALTVLFQSAGGRFPPRAVVTATVEPVSESANSVLFEQHFLNHPFILTTEKVDGVERPIADLAQKYYVVAVDRIKSAYIVDMGGEMLAANVAHLLLGYTKPDPLIVCGAAARMVRRLNENPVDLDKLCRVGFNQYFKDVFVYSMDRWGMNLLAKPYIFKENISKDELDAMRSYATGIRGKRKKDIEYDIGDWAMYRFHWGMELKDETALQDFFFQLQNEIAKR